MIAEPGSQYIGHVVPESGSAVNIMNAIYSFLTDNSISTNYLCGIGCDGTNTNTGWKGGVIVHLENKLNKSLEWLVYQLHANELPLRHLIIHLDGDTSGPSGFNGPIGRALKDCEKLPVLPFDPISVEDFPTILMDLSTEQQYLYDIYTFSCYIWC